MQLIAKLALLVAAGAAIVGAILFVAKTGTSPSSGDPVDSRADNSVAVDQEMPPAGDLHLTTREPATTPAETQPPGVAGESGDRIVRFDGLHFADYVALQPRYTDDDSAFEAKYADFSGAELLESETLISHVFRSEVEPWIEERKATGEYDLPSLQPDGTIGYPKGVPQADGRFVSSVRPVTLPNGDVVTASFTFPPEKYPLIDYRLRERNWISNRLHVLGLR